ncbi:hypothetical protein [Thermodesulfovibrio yellowstonii]|uniref:hypothetical protein n=1 Tax=Thermodesulfovibrio yellowstonii TaxID=28262 RepID=UPI00041F8698|nr:hypothetical protein [Thermodesulfovibrio islandicus]
MELSKESLKYQKELRKLKEKNRKKRIKIDKYVILKFLIFLLIGAVVSGIAYIGNPEPKMKLLSAEIAFSVVMLFALLIPTSTIKSISYYENKEIEDAESWEWNRPSIDFMKQLNYDQANEPDWSFLGGNCFHLSDNQKHLDD